MQKYCRCLLCSLFEDEKHSHHATKYIFLRKHHALHTLDHALMVEWSERTIFSSYNALSDIMFWLEAKYLHVFFQDYSIYILQNPFVYILISSRFQTGRRLRPSRHACVLVTYAKSNVQFRPRVYAWPDIDTKNACNLNGFLVLCMKKYFSFFLHETVEFLSLFLFFSLWEDCVSQKK